MPITGKDYLKMQKSFLQQRIGAVEDLEATIDSEDVTCAVSIIYEPGVLCFEIQEPAVETNRKEVKGWHAIQKWSCSVVIMSYF